MSSKSTVSWCESKYVHSNYIAEFYNSLSSISLILCGLIGYHKYSHLQGSIVYLIISIVGLGSVFFHSTLSIYGQMMDEMPMIFLVVQLVINSMRIENVLIKSLAYFYSVCYSWYIYRVSQTDTPINEFYIFQGSIILFAIVIFIRMINVNLPGRKSLIIKGVSVFLIGYGCWLIDFFLCDYIKQVIQFHSFWHIFSSIGLYYISKFSLIICN